MAGCGSVDAVNAVPHEDGSETTFVLPIAAISGVDSGYEVLSSLGDVVCMTVVVMALRLTAGISLSNVAGGGAVACFWRTAGLDLLDIFCAFSAFSTFSGVLAFGLTRLGGHGVLGFGARAVLGFDFLIGPPSAGKSSALTLFFPV